MALCVDDKGRIYASDQYGDLYRFPAPAAGQTLKAADIKKMPVNIRAINGMTWAFGALYAGVNDYEKKIPSGFYRLSDSDGDESPSFAPNGKLILYATQVQGKEALMTTTLDGKISAKLSGQTSTIREPNWGPFLKP